MFQNFVSPGWAVQDLNFPWHTNGQTYLRICDLFWLGFIVCSLRQGREQLREADRENIFLETLLSPVFTICISLWFRKKITVLPIHPLHLFSLLRSHRCRPSTPFQQQPWLSLCPQHVMGKPFEKWKASHSKATELIGCSESWYTVGRCKLAFFRTCWTWASLNAKCTWLQY